jgi:transcriptional regulator with XRE-family HTH domain
MPLLCSIGLPFVNIGKVITMVNERAARDRSPFGMRMYMARKRAGLTQKQVAKALAPLSQGTLSGLELDAASSGKIVEFAKLYNVDAAWLSTGLGIAPPGIDDNIIDVVATLVQPPKRLAHAPIQSQATFAHQRARQHVPWGELGMRELEGTFSVDAPDDAMAPVIKRGARVDFDRSLEPRTDDVVLLKDGSGVWYIRTYQQGPRNRWGAKAENNSFLPMDSERDELGVIAVLTAVHGRRG